MRVVIAEDLALLRDGLSRLLRDNGFEVIAAVRRVAEGGTALDPEVVAQLLSKRKPLDVLSPRELEVLGLMAEGRSNAAIAKRLVLTVGAVEKHVASILAKLRLPPSSEDHRRVLAVLAYLRQVD